MQKREPAKTILGKEKAVKSLIYRPWKSWVVPFLAGLLVLAQPVPAAAQGAGDGALPQLLQDINAVIGMMEVAVQQDDPQALAALDAALADLLQALENTPRHRRHRGAFGDGMMQFNNGGDPGMAGAPNGGAGGDGAMPPGHHRHHRRRGAFGSGMDQFGADAAPSDNGANSRGCSGKDPNGQGSDPNRGCRDRGAFHRGMKEFGGGRCSRDRDRSRDRDCRCGREKPRQGRDHDRIGRHGHHPRQGPGSQFEHSSHQPQGPGGQVDGGHHQAPGGSAGQFPSKEHPFGGHVKPGAGNGLPAAGGGKPQGQAVPMGPNHKPMTRVKQADPVVRRKGAAGKQNRQQVGNRAGGNRGGRGQGAGANLGKAGGRGVGRATAGMSAGKRSGKVGPAAQGQRQKTYAGRKTGGNRAPAFTGNRGGRAFGGGIRPPVNRGGGFHRGGSFQRPPAASRGRRK
jgi:hypothetical protein